MQTNHYGFIDAMNSSEEFRIQQGQVIAGYTVGILLLEVWYPLLPGNVVNASTFTFPIRHKLITGATKERVHGGDPSLAEEIIKVGRELELEGVRAICGACGYLANFQNLVSAGLDVPVYLSSLLQVPMILSGIKPDEKIGVLCADAFSFTAGLLEKCGIHMEVLTIQTGRSRQSQNHRQVVF